MTLSREWGEGDRTALLGVSGLDTVTHWSSGADRHQAPGWRLPAESRPQGRRSPVWHSPAGGLESEAQPGPWRALRHTGCPRPGPPRETPLAPCFQTAKRAGSATISFTRLVRLSQTLATSRCKHLPCTWARHQALGTCRSLSLRQRLGSPEGP